MRLERSARGSASTNGLPLSYAMRNRLAFLLMLALPQRTPSGGAIARFVPPALTPASFVSDQRGVLAADAHASLDPHIAGVQHAGLGDIAVAILP